MHETSANVVGGTSADEKHSWFRLRGMTESGVRKKLGKIDTTSLKQRER
jgi:hypothetical protein